MQTTRFLTIKQYQCHCLLIFEKHQRLCYILIEHSNILTWIPEIPLYVFWVIWYILFQSILLLLIWCTVTCDVAMCLYSLNPASLQFLQQCKAAFSFDGQLFVSWSRAQLPHVGFLEQISSLWKWPYFWQTLHLLTKNLSLTLYDVSPANNLLPCFSIAARAAFETLITAKYFWSPGFVSFTNITLQLSSDIPVPSSVFWFVPILNKKES